MSKKAPTTKPATKSKKPPEFNPKHKDFFKDVDYIVEATPCESLLLWRMHSLASQAMGSAPPNGPFINWVEDVKSTSWILQLGKIDKRNVSIHLRYVMLNDKKVVFITPAYHTLMDFDLLKRWYKFVAPKIKRETALFFDHCLVAIGAYDPPKEDKA